MCVCVCVCVCVCACAHTTLTRPHARRYINEEQVLIEVYRQTTKLVYNT